jgi:ATP-binding cassette, subfamily C (CFTR/MRP), member 1
MTLLDDVFSGLDDKTAKHVFSQLLEPGGLLRSLGHTVVMIASTC